MSRSLLSLGVLVALSGCATVIDASVSDGTGLIYAWAGDHDRKDPDFLAVLDARPESPTFGSVLASVPVPGLANGPHHSEYELTPGQGFWANGWASGRTFRFDLTDPRAPRLAGEFAERGGYTYPHSYARLANGHVLAAFQSNGAGYTPTGGLVALDSTGTFIRASSGASAAVPANEAWSYSLLVIPELDRVVTTNTRMGMPSEGESAMKAAMDSTHHHVSLDVESKHVQVWRLSDLTLLHTLVLPSQEGGHNAWTAEPRRLANGDIYVNTFSCGLYRLTGVETDAPKAEPTLFSEFKGSGACAVPVVVGNFWIQPSSVDNVITAYDLSDPAAPRIASKLQLDSAHTGPHWLALDPERSRIVVTFDTESWVLIVNVDASTGALSIDERFRDAGSPHAGVSLDRPTWPHGNTGRATAHGAVFGVRTPAITTP